MSLLDPGTAPADPVLTPPPADPAPAPADPAPADPMADAAGKLFGEDAGKPPADPAKADPAPVERDPALPPENETPEQKAAREAAETPEQKAAREAAEAKVEKAKTDAERYGAPEGDYEAFALPEGVKLDDEGAKAVSDFAKEMNLSQKSAQKLIDIAAAKAQRDGQAAQAQLDGIHNSWVEQSRSDKEFGGDKLNASLATAQKALKEFGTPELHELVVGARLGDHPEFIRLMTRVGSRLSEAPIVNGGKPVAGDAGDVLYPNLKK